MDNVMYVPYYGFLQGIFNVLFATIAFVFFIRVFYSSLTHSNLALRYVSYAALALSLDYYVEGIPLILFLQNPTVIAISITVIGVLLIHATLSFMLAIVLVTDFPSVKRIYSAIPFAVGTLAALMNYAHNKGAITYTQNGFVDPDYFLISEFLTFLTTIVCVLLLANTLTSQFSIKGRNKRALLLSVGAVMIALSSPIVYISQVPTLFYFLNGLTFTGLMFMLVGVFLPHAQQSIAEVSGDAR